MRSGEEALVELDRHPVRIVILDVGLPGIDGFDVCREMRARSRVPILMLTARDEEADRIVGLEVGADDYLTKPFSPARARRADEGDPAPVRAADRPTTCSSSATSRSNRGTHDVTIAGEPVELTAKEFDLLAYFLANPGAVLSRDVLLDRVWGVVVPGRDAHGRRPRRPAPAQARPARSDPHAPRQRLQGGQRLEDPAGPALRGDAGRARADPGPDDRDRRRPDAPAGRPDPGAALSPGRPTALAIARRQSVSYVNSDTAARRGRADDRRVPGPCFARLRPGRQPLSERHDDLPGQALHLLLPDDPVPRPLAAAARRA